MSLYPADFTESVIDMMSGSFRNSSGEMLEPLEVVDLYRKVTGKRTREIFKTREELLQDFSEIKTRADLAFCLRKTGKYWEKVVSIMDDPQISNEFVIVAFYVCMVLNKEINDQITAAINYLIESEGITQSDLLKLSKDDRIKDLYIND